MLCCCNRYTSKSQWLSPVKAYPSFMPWSILNYAKGVGDEERAGVAWGISKGQAQKG